jgi:hypothetical protein
MPRMKQTALSNPPSQLRVEGGLDSAPSLIANTVAVLSCAFPGVHSTSNINSLILI